MASFSKRISKKTGKTCWRARVRCAGTPDLSATSSRLTDAKRRATQTEASIQSGRYLLVAESKRRKLDDVLELCLPEIMQQLKNPFSRIEHLTYWRFRLGSLTLEKIRPHVIKSYREALRESLSDATANRYLASLSAAFTFALKGLEWLQTNPCLTIKRLKEPKGRTRFLSEQERTDLLAAWQSQQACAAVKF